VENGNPITEEEQIDNDTRYNDRVMLSLRTCEGLSLDSLSTNERNYCLKQAQRFIDGGELLYDAPRHRLRLSRNGIFVSDMVMSQLMRV
jgi:oxygen-independent coproporphyrinogen-3 oxidase